MAARSIFERIGRKAYDLRRGASLRRPPAKHLEETMPKDAAERPDAPRDLSRRNLLKGVGLTGAAAATTFAAVVPPPAPAAAQTAEPRLEALETLTADEADTLDAIVARLIPDDEN